MTSEVPQEFRRMLARCGQEHVLRWWSELDAAQRAALQRQIETIDIDRVNSLVSARRQETPAKGAESFRTRAASPPAGIHSQAAR